MRRIALAGVAALVVSAAACTHTFDSAQLGVPATMAEAAREPVAGDSFAVTRHPVYLLWGLVPAAQPNLEDVLAGQVGTGSRVANLRIRVRSSWSDLLVTVLTLGLAVPRSVTFEGVVVPR
jgi:hypothetical protein